MTLHGKANQDPLSAQCKIELVQALWPRHPTPASPTDEVQDWDTYFRYYIAECRKAIEPKRGECTTVRKHEDIVAIADELRRKVSKRDIKQALRALDTRGRSEDVKEKMAEGSVRLVVRLFAMVDIGPTSDNRTQGPAPLPWINDDADLSTILAKHFVRSSIDSGKTKFSEEFTAFNIRRLAGLEIRWTENLADHLRLIENDRTLCVFHHVTFLKHRISDNYPKGLIDETLRTLDLLFPRYDSDTQRWLASECTSTKDAIQPDPALLTCDRMMSDDRCAATFSYWRDKLLTLKDKFDQPQHTSMAQFWYDRRNKIQWYTFWIAVLVLCLTVFFGLVQSLEGALQVYKAYHPTPN